MNNYLKNNKPYYLINREERNLAAIFYHVLLINNNLEKFISKLNIDYPVVVQKPVKSESHPVLLWKDAFDGLDLTGCPHFITEWIRRL